MRQCPNCKSDNPDDARFCNYCGMRLPESKEETLYNDLEGLEKARKVEFSDQEIAEESEKVIDEAKKLFEPEWSEEPEENDGLKKQLTIPENLDHMIEEVTREELEKELQVLKVQHQGSLLMITARGTRSEIIEKIQAKNPLFMEVLPLTLEEIFISETEVAGYEIKNLF